MTIQNDIRKVFSEIRNVISNKYIEREELIDSILFSILARQNGCVIGTPGVAKSAVIRSITQLLEEPAFSVLLTKTTMPEEVVGMLDFDSATKGVQKRNIDGYLPTAKVGFFDEIWKASSAIRNALLTIINEKIFRNGAEEIDIPLWSVWAASNEYPQGEEDNAMWDRFLIRLEVKEIQDSNNFRNLIANNTNSKTVIISETSKELLKGGLIEKAQQEVANLSISNEVIDVYEELRIVLRNAGVVPSDRRWLASLEVVKALAYIKGKKVVDKSDLSILEHILWEVPEQKETVKSNIMKIIAPYKYQIYSLVQECDDIVSNVEQGDKTVNYLEAIKKINSITDEVRSLIADEGITLAEKKYGDYVINQFEQKGKKLIDYTLKGKNK